MLLKVQLLHHHTDTFHEHVVVRLWKHNSWEEITCDVFVQSEIVLQELRIVDIINGTKHEHRLVHVSHLALQVTRSSQHRLDGTHSIVIMLLAGELL